MHYYAVIDTNVVVSAMLKWQSLPGNILELVFDGIITPVRNILNTTSKKADQKLHGSAQVC